MTTSMRRVGHGPSAGSPGIWYDSGVPLPQDPNEGPSVLDGSEFGGGMSDVAIVVTLILSVVVIACGLWLSREGQPNWRTRRATKAAKKAASRWAETKTRI